jgi:hypothetical protein
MKRDSEHGTISTPLLRYGKIGGQFSFLCNRIPKMDFRTDGLEMLGTYSVHDELEAASPDSRLSL